MDNVTDKNPADDQGWTPYHTAAKNGKIRIVQDILANVTNKNPADKKAHTPLHCAAKAGHIQIVKAILNMSPIKLRLMKRD